MDVLSKSLLARFRRRELGHFYILQARQSAHLASWMNEFLIAVLSDDGTSATHALGRLERGHPDVLWLKPQDDSYKVENGDFDPLFQTMAHRPLELPWRFIVVEKPETISDVYANKLLKTLEEPCDSCSIIFLLEQGRTLMSTIESRAIKLTLAQEKGALLGSAPAADLAQFLTSWCASYPQYFDEGLEFAQDRAALASELASLARSKPKVEENLFTALQLWAQENVTKPQVLESVLEALKHADFSRRLNNSCHERFYTLIHSMGPKA